MNEITYTRAGDFLLPDIILQDGRDSNGEIKPLRRYGLMHKAYLKEHRPILYNCLLLSERLYPLCREVDEAADTRLRTIADREQAHEVILSELVYV